MNITDATSILINRKNLSKEEITEVMTAIMSGEHSDAQIAGFLVALAAKGETLDEISAAAEVMRSLSVKVELSDADAIDVVGTGGDGLKTVNVSTASAVVAAACGATVAKHGNRAASSSSGSADFLEKANVPMNMSPEQVTACIDKVGIGFMFAPNHHPAMKYAIGARKELKLRTIFNYLGPLTNPAGVKRILLGVSKPDIVRPMAGVLDALGFDAAMVVHGDDGMDEISITGPTTICSLQDGQIFEMRINPEDVGLKSGAIEDIVVKDADESLTKIKAAFSGEASSIADVIALNSGAALVVAGKVEEIADGVEMANAAMSDGRALAKLEQWSKIANGLVHG